MGVAHCWARGDSGHYGRLPLAEAGTLPAGQLRRAYWRVWPSI